MHPHHALGRGRRSSRATLLAAVLTSALALSVLTATPAAADPSDASSKDDLAAQLQAAAGGATTTIRLGADLVAADAAHDALTTPDGSAITLDLRGHQLSLLRLTVGVGAQLEVTDSTSTGTTVNGLLQVGPAAGTPSSTVTGVAVGSGATLRVTATAVTATGSDAGTAAGIGSPAGVTDHAGSLVVTGRAIVRGQGGRGGAGIGGAQGAAAIAVSVQDARVEGLGGLGGAGIGSGRGGASFAGLSSSTSVTSAADVGDFSRFASSIDASGGRGAAGIGGGLNAAGGPVTLDGNTDANVSTAGAVTSAPGTPSLVGAGQAPSATTSAFGSLHLGRHAWLWGNDPADALLVPDGAVVDNEGSIRVLGGVRGGGTISNHGLISTVPITDTSASTDPKGLVTVEVTGHDYLLRLDSNGGTAASTTEVRVYCRYLDAGTLPTPTAPRAGESLMAWNTAADGRGEDLGTQSLEDLTGEESTDGAPVPLDLFARYGETPHATADRMPVAGVGRVYDQPLPIAGEGITGFGIADRDDAGTALPGLPAGLGLDAASGRVSGRPTETGTYRFLARSYGRSPAEGWVTLVVAGAPSIATGSLPAGQQGSGYAVRLVASGEGVTTWDATSGTLPAGLSLTPDGLLAGTPSGGGSTEFTVRATNAYGSSVATLTIDVAAATPAPVSSTTPAASAPASTPRPTAPRLPDARQVTTRFGHHLALSLGASSTTPVSYSLRGRLPVGVEFDERTALISGAPAESGRFSATVVATSDGGSASASFLLIVPAQRALIGVRSAPRVVTGTAPTTVDVTGARKGERYRVLVDGRSVREGRFARTGAVRITVPFAKASKDVRHRVEIRSARRVVDPATTASVRFSVTSVSATKRLKATRVAGGVTTVVVSRLAPHEPVTIRSAGRAIAVGRADGEGTFVLRRWKAGAGTRTLVVTGATEQRKTTLVVRTPKR